MSVESASAIHSCDGRTQEQVCAGSHRCGHSHRPPPRAESRLHGMSPPAHRQNGACRDRACMRRTWGSGAVDVLTEGRTYTTWQTPIVRRPSPGDRTFSLDCPQIGPPIPQPGPTCRWIGFGSELGPITPAPPCEGTERFIARCTAQGRSPDSRRGCTPPGWRGRGSHQR